MANRIEGVTERILACAKQEFMAKGFRDASLRTIAGNAETTPRSIYTRYNDKEGLFGALVSPALEVLQNKNKTEQEAYHQKPAEQQAKLFSDPEFFAHYEKMEESIINHIYDYFDAFQLLVNCSEGTSYADFMDVLVKLDVDYTIKYIETTNNSVFKERKASSDLIEVLCRLLYEGYFETVRRNMTRDEAFLYIRQLRRFFELGWKDLLSL